MKATKALLNTIFYCDPDELIECILEIKINQFTLKGENISYGLYLYCNTEDAISQLTNNLIKKLIETKHPNIFKKFKMYDLLK